MFLLFSRFPATLGIPLPALSPPTHYSPGLPPPCPPPQTKTARGQFLARSTWATFVHINFFFCPQFLLLTNFKIICYNIVSHGYHFLFLSVFFIITAVCLFAALFEIQLKKNVLRPEDQSRGFSSTDKAQLGYSFWILLGAAGVLLLCPLIILMKKVHCTHYFKTRKHEISNVDGVMLY